MSDDYTLSFSQKVKSAFFFFFLSLNHAETEKVRKTCFGFYTEGLGSGILGWEPPETLKILTPLQLGQGLDLKKQQDQPKQRLHGRRHNGKIKTQRETLRSTVLGVSWSQILWEHLQLLHPCPAWQVRLVFPLQPQYGHVRQHSQLHHPYCSENKKDPTSKIQQRLSIN